MTWHNLVGTNQLIGEREKDNNSLIRIMWFIANIENPLNAEGFRWQKDRR